MDYKTFYDQHWRLVWASILIVPPAVLLVGCLAWPEVFWDGFLWKYIAGPLVADARGEEQGGIAEGYNVVNTLLYALILAVAVLGIWRLFNRLGIRIDRDFLLAIVPWIILGSTLRALEDASLFPRDGVLVYLFISPVIYMLVGFVVLGLVVWSHLIEGQTRSHGTRRGLLWASYVVLCLNIPPAVVHALAPGQMAHHAPYWALPLASAVGLAVLWWRAERTGTLRMTDQVLVHGSVLAAFSLYFVVRWVGGEDWRGGGQDLAPWELLWIPAIALGCTAATAVLFWALSRRWETARAFLAPVSVLLYASHFLDGTATYRGVDLFGYGEKHVLPSFLIDLTGTAAVMLPLKFLVVTFAVYLLDVAYRKDLEEAPNLAWLVKVAIMVLGLAPGIRDMLRLAMGV